MSGGAAPLGQRPQQPLLGGGHSSPFWGRGHSGQHSQGLHVHASLQHHLSKKPCWTNERQRQRQRQDVARGSRHPNPHSPAGQYTNPAGQYSRAPARRAAPPTPPTSPCSTAQPRWVPAHHRATYTAVPAIGSHASTCWQASAGTARWHACPRVCPHQHLTAVTRSRTRAHGRQY